MAAESSLLDTWLYGVLSGDAALAAAMAALAADTPHPDAWAGAWWPEQAAEQTPHPFGLWQWSFPGDFWALGGVRAVEPVTLRIYVVAATGDYSDLAPVAARVDTLLHGALQTTGPLLVFQCLRTREYRRAELFAGVRYRHLGGEYALMTRSNA